MRVPLRSRSVRRQSSRGMQSLRRGRTRAGELVEEAVPLVDRGRDVAESLARGAAEHVPSRRRSRRRRRGVIAVVLLAVGAGVALYLAWQRRDNEPARLVFEPAGPDVAPPPMPEPPQPPVEEVQADPVMAVNTDVTEGAPESVPEAEPVSARAEIEIPLAVAPGVDSVEDELDNVAMAEELSELAVDLESVAEADETAAYPGADLAEDLAPDPVAVEDATELAATEAPEEPVGATPVLGASHTPTRSSTWFEAAVGETSDPVPEVERSMPLRGPRRGGSSLPPSSPSGAPFRPAGDSLPAGRSWPTLPN